MLSKPFHAGILHLTVFAGGRNCLGRGPQEVANHSLGLLGVGMKSCPSQPSPAGPLSCTVFVLESGWLALPWCSLNLKVESGDYELSPTCKLLFFK